MHRLTLTRSIESRSGHQRNEEKNEAKHFREDFDKVWELGDEDIGIGVWKEIIIAQCSKRSRKQKTERARHQHQEQKKEYK